MTILIEGLTPALQASRVTGSAEMPTFWACMDRAASADLLDNYFIVQ
jgi:hypothetical protein